ncbi:MAG: hypothetical protein ACXWUU_07515 [Burkholderiales bacterium]
MSKLASLPRKELITFRGGANQGDSCAGLAYHGFNGLEQEVTTRIVVDHGQVAIEGPGIAHT